MGKKRLCPVERGKSVAFLEKDDLSVLQDGLEELQQRKFSQAVRQILALVPGDLRGRF